jgi:hypothetical protein
MQAHQPMPLTIMHSCAFYEYEVEPCVVFTTLLQIFSKDQLLLLDSSKYLLCCIQFGVSFGHPQHHVDANRNLVGLLNFVHSHVVIVMAALNLFVPARSDYDTYRHSQLLGLVPMLASHIALLQTITLVSNSLGRMTPLFFALLC